MVNKINRTSDRKTFLAAQRKFFKTGVFFDNVTNFFFQFEETTYELYYWNISCKVWEKSDFTNSGGRWDKFKPAAKVQLDKFELLNHSPLTWNKMYKRLKR